MPNNDSMLVCQKLSFGDQVRLSAICNAFKTISFSHKRDFEQA